MLWKSTEMASTGGIGRYSGGFFLQLPLEKEEEGEGRVR